MRKQPVYVEFEVFNLDTGNTVGHAYSPDEVLRMAQDYRANPSIVFIGIDSTGYQGQMWTISDVVRGAFEGDLRRITQRIERVAKRGETTSVRGRHG